MRFYYAVQNFSLVSAAPPSHWTRVEVGDLIKYSPAGVLTVYRRGSIVEQQAVSNLAVKSFLRWGGSRWPKLPAPAAPTHRGSFLRPQ
jgi:hypothetical protein